MWWKWTNILKQLYISLISFIRRSGITYTFINSKSRIWLIKEQDYNISRHITNEFKSYSFIIQKIDRIQTKPLGKLALSKDLKYNGVILSHLKSDLSHVTTFFYAIIMAIQYDTAFTVTYNHYRHLLEDGIYIPIIVYSKSNQL